MSSRVHYSVYIWGLYSLCYLFGEMIFWSPTYTVFVSGTKISVFAKWLKGWKVM